VPHAYQGKANGNESFVSLRSLSLSVGRHFKCRRRLAPTKRHLHPMWRDFALYNQDFKMLVLAQNRPFDQRTASYTRQ
jgi:hypothetical protein